VHPYAHSAAAAAEAAAAQGQFWTMHEYLFKHQAALGPPDLLRYALELRLDRDRFEQDRSSTRVGRRIERDLTSGRASGVDATPTFYVNGLRHQGSFQVASLRLQIHAELERHHGRL
jgi:protein-disulfide isomerase